MLSVDVAVDRRDFTVRASLEVGPGGRLALFGPSGAGKTTVLEAIAGLVTPRSGTIEVAGRLVTSTGYPVVSVPSWQRGVGMLRQEPALFPHLSVGANLLYARSARAAAGELDGLARVLGIDGLLTEMPARLSGGQRHRVALGRLLMARCDVLLLDEPFSGLDAVLRRTLTRLVAELVSERGIPSVLVTHQLTDAQAFADRLAVIDRGEVLQEGAPDEVVRRPASRRAAELLGYLGFIPVPDGVPGTPAGGVVAGVHPERVVAGADPSRGLVVTGVVAAARPSGAGWEADMLAAGTPFTCRLSDRPSGGDLTVTLLDPPYFTSDGKALAGSLPVSVRREERQADH